MLDDVARMINHATSAPPPLNIDEDVLFLDFDGTLVDIAPAPDAVRVPSHLGPLLATLHDTMDDRIAILSGRTIPEIEEFLPDFDGTVIGHHGAQVRTNGQHHDRVKPNEKLQAVAAEAAAWAEQTEGLLFESKPYGFALHFRARPAKGAEVKRFLDDRCSNIDGIAVEGAKMAYEVKPSRINKGEALKWYLTEVANTDAAPVHVGDDHSDAAAFQTAKRLGGFGVHVGDGHPAARYVMPTPVDVRIWLTKALS